ncbi:MAG: dTMP kinase, partial [Candidatus Aenigmarchaeota archaeon]|nr:dTMP kinase [Candidatus Aenigmarchaeota archaeon]
FQRIQSVFILFYQIKNMRGKYIVLEGIDGSGKSTQAKKLARYLSNSILTREPTDYGTGKLIRQVLMEYNLNDKKAEGERETLLFFADRIDHHDLLIKPSIIKGKNIISDRSYHSTLAYEGALKVDTDFIIDLRNRYVNRGFIKKPDLTLIVDLPVNVAIERMASKTKEKFEVRDFLEKIRKIYLNMSDYFDDENIILINGDADEKTVYRDIRNTVRKELRI